MTEPTYFTESDICPDQAMLYLTPWSRYFGVWSAGQVVFDQTYPGAFRVNHAALIEMGRQRRLAVLAEIDKSSQKAREY